MTTSDKLKLAALRLQLSSVKRNASGVVIKHPASDTYTDRSAFGYSPKEHDDRLEALSEDFGRANF